MGPRQCVNDVIAGADVLSEVSLRGWPSPDWYSDGAANVAGGLTVETGRRWIRPSYVTVFQPEVINRISTYDKPWASIGVNT